MGTQICFCLTEECAHDYGASCSKNLNPVTPCDVGRLIYLCDSIPMERRGLVNRIILRSYLKTRQGLFTILQRVFNRTMIAKLSSEYYALWCTWLPTETGHPESEQRSTSCLRLLPPSLIFKLLHTQQRKSLYTADIWVSTLWRYWIHKPSLKTHCEWKK